MNPTTIFCPNEECIARGEIGKGNIKVHSQKQKRYKCKECGKTFTESKGTVYYRMKYEEEIITKVITLIAFGCPLQAIVEAFEIDERTVSSWRERAGKHCLAVHEHLVEKPRDLQQVQVDELYSKQQDVAAKGKALWIAMAIWVQTRLWLGCEVSQRRDFHLVKAMMQRVKSCAMIKDLVIITDGFRAYFSAICMVFRQTIETKCVGRPRLKIWKELSIGQMVKQYSKGRVVGSIQRVLRGTATLVSSILYNTQGRGQITTVYIERLNATFRQRLSSLSRRSRSLVRHSDTLRYSLFLVGSVYNFCSFHHSLSFPDISGKLRPRTPAMASNITNHRWSVRSLLSFRIPPPPFSPPPTPKSLGRPKFLVEYFSYTPPGTL